MIFYLLPKKDIWRRLKSRAKKGIHLQYDFYFFDEVADEGVAFDLFWCVVLLLFSGFDGLLLLLEGGLEAAAAAAAFWRLRCLDSNSCQSPVTSNKLYTKMRNLIDQ